MRYEIKQGENMKRLAAAIVAGTCALLVVGLFLAALLIPTTTPLSSGVAGKLAVRRNETFQIAGHIRGQKQADGRTKIIIGHMVDIESAHEAPSSPGGTPCCEFQGNSAHHQTRDEPVRIYNAPSRAFVNEFKDAVKLWLEASNGISLVGMITESSAAFDNDVQAAAAASGVNTVAHAPIEWDGGTALGVTTIWVDSATMRHISAWSVVINSDVLDICDATHVATCYHRPCIFRHEFGHVYGLKDLYTSVCSNTLMYYSLSRGETCGVKVDSTTATCIQTLYENQGVEGEVDNSDDFINGASSYPNTSAASLLYLLSFGFINFF